MAGKVIGKTLPLGFAGNVSRMSDCVIAPYKYDISHDQDGHIVYGEPVAYDTTAGGVRKLTASDQATAIIGFAVRRLGQPRTDYADGWYYEAGDTVDVLLRGSMSVALEDATGIAPLGAVYVDPATGKLYAATATGRLAVPNAKFGTGAADTNKVAEITVVERVI